jgi:hypothetical protein
MSGVIDLASLAYDQSQAYNKHDYVLKDSALYRAIAAISANTAWNDDHWQERSWTDEISYAKHDCVLKDEVLYRAEFVVSHSKPWSLDSWEEMTWDDSAPYKPGDIVLQDGNLFKVKDNWDTQSPNWESISWSASETYTAATDYVQYNHDGALTLYRATLNSSASVPTNISGWDSAQWEASDWSSV